MSDTATLAHSAPAAPPPVEVLWLPARQMEGQRPSLNGPLLVDGSDGDDLGGPLRLGQLLARRDRVRVRVLAVAAYSDAAAYVLRGLPALGTSGREGSGRLASRLAVEAATPVLAVPPNVRALPRSVLAAVDGGDASMDAARAALPLLGEFGSLTLLHIVPSGSRAGGRSPVVERQHRVRDVLRSLAKELGGSADVAVHLVVLQGDPQAVLAEWVSGFDLVTLGASSHETIEPASEASTSGIVFENAPGAILVAPAVRELVEPTPGRRHANSEAQLAFVRK